MRYFVLLSLLLVAADLPDRKLTPGELKPGVTVEQICTRGYANVLNGGARCVTPSMRRDVFVSYFGEVPTNTADYELDHLVPVSIGGQNSIKNLWPQRYEGEWGAHVKDRLEVKLYANLRKELYLNGHDAAVKLLKRYQREISQNWTNCYKKNVNPSHRTWNDDNETAD